MRRLFWRVVLGAICVIVLLFGAVGYVVRWPAAVGGLLLDRLMDWVVLKVREEGL